MWNRIAAILVGMAITFPLERWWSVPWYFSLPLGVLGYACVRYIGYFVRERRYVKNMMVEAVKNAKARDQISN
jgi:cytosine/uracil/thiamine/allantoin permease